MKALLVITINFYLIFSSYGRLMYKTTESPKVNIENVDDTDVSKEKNHHFEDIFKFYNRKVRMAKETKADVSKNVTSLKAVTSKTVLVKKPIPKFHEESDEDYQNKMRMPSKLSDTMEHEDEDFNVDDYDFDVNHDEFAGRGKPLEPRTKVKLNKQQSHHVEQKISESRPDPVVELTSISLKSKNIVPRKVADKLKEDEYDDEFLEKKTTESSIRASALEEEGSDENEESNEFKGSAGIRTIRSPWSFSHYVNKLEEKTSAFMSRVLSILPIFPQQPSKKLVEEVYLIKEPSAQQGKIMTTA